MASIKYKTSEGYTSIPMNIIGSRIYLEDYDDGEVIPELVDDNAKLGNGIGTCSTSTGTALEVTLANYKLVKNGIVAVTFEYDVPANATLNINNKGAKPIYNEGSAIEADVIKAGKTVMFAYDGTHYVVTSLGGSGEDGEIVVVRCSTDNDTAVTGWTVTINGTQYTLDSTGIAAAKIPFGTTYSVVASNLLDFEEPSVQTFTANKILREVTIKWIFDDGCVNLGLPSGLRWATHNIGATNVYDYGLYFSWGNIDGHNLNGAQTEYNFSASDYSSTTGYSLSGNIPSTSLYDAAVNYKSNYRLPTHAECDELYNNTDIEIINDYQGSGINVWKLMKKTDHDVFIILPCTGRCNDGTWPYFNGNAHYWTSTIYSEDTSRAYSLSFNNGAIGLLSLVRDRYCGFAIRPVKS